MRSDIVPSAIPRPLGAQLRGSAQVCGRNACRAGAGFLVVQVNGESELMDVTLSMAAIRSSTAALGELHRRTVFHSQFTVYESLFVVTYHACIRVKNISHNSTISSGLASQRQSMTVSTSVSTTPGAVRIQLMT